MKRLATAAAALAIGLASLSVAAAAPENSSKPIHNPASAQCRDAGFTQFAATVWRLDRWQRGAPTQSADAALRRRLGRSCDPGRLKALWRAHRRLYGRWRVYRHLAPEPGFVGHGRWLRWLAVPRAIVECESHGEWSAANPSGAVGPYQLLGWGAPYPATTWREKMEHHRIAGDLYRASGTAPWAASASCWG